MIPIVAAIDSMTPQERTDPTIIKTSRMERIARGSGATIDVLKFLLQFAESTGRDPFEFEPKVSRRVNPRRQR